MIHEESASSDGLPKCSASNPKKRDLECAGIVDEKCHPNPAAKKYRLEDVVRVRRVGDLVVERSCFCEGC